MQAQTGSKFNITELVMIIVVLCILTVVAVPIYYNLCAEARISSERTTVHMVRAGIQAYSAAHAQGGAGAYPAALDGARDGAAGLTNRFFEKVLSEGGVVSEWKKQGNRYSGPNSGTYTYNNTDGSFK